MSATATEKSERGAAALELVLIAPVLMVTVMLLAQWAVREQGLRAVGAAAREAATATAAYGATTHDGQATAAEILETTGTDLSDIQTSIIRSAATATATVTAQVPSLLPGVDLTVTSTQTTPIEAFVP